MGGGLLALGANEHRDGLAFEQQISKQVLAHEAGCPGQECMHAEGLLERRILGETQVRARW
jgi:hypothetical protein